MTEKQRVFITVKTYPILSEKYDELVCTAGILENGNWVRIYPLPFRKLDYEDRFKKYQWIQIELQRNTSDMRPESYRPVNYDDLDTQEMLGTENKWLARKGTILKNQYIYDDINEVITKARNNELSLAIFKPPEGLSFSHKEDDRDWDPKKIAAIISRHNQMKLPIFQTEKELTNELSLVKKLPYKFYYNFKKSNGRKCSLQITDWEIGEFYWECLASTDGDEEEALRKVAQRYTEEFPQKDLYLFLGTYYKSHIRRFRNPFGIIGVFYPPADS